MSQIRKQLAKEKSFEVLMNDIEHPHHKGRPGYVQHIDIKYEVDVPDREYTYHAYGWKNKNNHNHVKNITTDHKLTTEESAAQVVAKIPHRKWTPNSFDEELYKHINFQYP
uniref:Uncharacterized protein n=1 Tax=Acrobeloides nanus TaxID=290746 RepID=A0A914C3J0_9BILA